MPLQSAQALELTDSGRKAKRLGDLNSVSAFAGLLAMGFVYLVSTRLGFRQLFLVAALVTLGGAVVMILPPRARAADKPRGFVVRRRYLTYYGLTFLASSRRQIATTFAVFALVKLYGTPVRTIALLMLVSNVVAVLTRSLCGRLVDRLGESLAMQLGYGSVVLIFLCYAFVTQREVLYLLYILDNFLMGFDVAQTTYLDRIAPKEDLAGSLALGSTINHVTGVTAPIVGGYLWARFGHPATFMLGAAVACASFYVAGKVPRAAVTPRAAAPSVAP
jgi:predicted MFS family arabinose efflux permease